MLTFVFNITCNLCNKIHVLSVGHATVYTFRVCNVNSLLVDNLRICYF